MALEGVGEVMRWGTGLRVVAVVRFVWVVRLLLVVSHDSAELTMRVRLFISIWDASGTGEYDDCGE